MISKVALIVSGVIVLGICAVIWYVLGQLVVFYARMEAEERIDDLTTGPDTANEDHPD